MIHVLGFLFDTNDDRVVLIRKERPEWAKHHLNGVGGKIENGETPGDAMAREFREETGAWIPPGMWREFGRMEFIGNDDEIVLFEAQVAVEQSLYDIVRTTTDEEVVVQSVKKVDFEPCVRSVKWLIRAAQDRNKTIHVRVARRNHE